MKKISFTTAAIAIAAVILYFGNAHNSAFAHSPDIGPVLATEMIDEEEGEIYNQPRGVYAPVAAGGIPSAHSLHPGADVRLLETQANLRALTARASLLSEDAPDPGVAGVSAKVTPGILELPWVADGLTDHERFAYNLLAELDEFSPEAAARIVAMPFLQSFGTADTEAIYVLTAFAEEDIDTLFAVLDNPNLADNGGIEDDEAKIVAVLIGPWILNPELIDVLLDPDQIRLEERIIQTSYSDSILFTIVRTQSGGASTMGLFEHAVEYAEIMMGKGLRTDYVAVLVMDGFPPGIGGFHTYANITIPTEMDVDDRTMSRLAAVGPAVIAHEVAHYYWFNDIDLWVDEGAADFMALIIEHYRVGGYGDPDGIPCPYYENIFHLELAQPEAGSYGQICDYWLGERIYLDLFNTLRYEQFYDGFRAFHSLIQADYGVTVEETESGAPAIDRMLAAFHATARNPVETALIDAVLARRYGTVLFTDRSPVNPVIPAVNGQVLRTDLIRVTRGQIVESHNGFFSIPASRISGRYLMALTIAHAAPLAADVELDFAVVEYYEDGFVLDRTVETVGFSAGRPGTIAVLAGIGFIPDFRWPTGLYWAYAYHGGQKVGEIFFEVAP